MTDFDRASLDRLLPATAGSPDWADVLSRSGVVRARRRRYATAVALVMLVVAGSAAAFGLRLLGTGFIGLPPEGAKPSSPKTGTLVASLIGRSARRGHGVLIRIWVYTDGRVIWMRQGSLPQGANRLTTGLLEQRLTSEGVERLRSDIVSTGLFDRDAALASRRYVWGSVVLRVGDRLVHVRWQHPDLYAGDPDMKSYKPATPEQARALGRLDSMLKQPASVLPASAWDERQIRAYVPSKFAACYEVLPKALSEPPRDPSVFLSLAPSAVGAVLKASPTTRHRGARGWAGGPYYPYHYACAAVTTEQTRAMVRSFDDARIARFDRAHRLGFSFRVPGRKRETADIVFEPLLPDGQWTCTPCG